MNIMERLAIGILLQSIFVTLFSGVILIIVECIKSIAPFSVLKKMIRCALLFYILPIPFIKYFINPFMNSEVITVLENFQFNINNCVIYMLPQVNRVVLAINYIGIAAIIIILLIGVGIFAKRIVEYHNLKHCILSIEQSRYYYDNMLVIVTQNSGPFSTGVLKNIIVLPSYIKNDSFELILHHESLHHKNHDLVWKSLLILVKSLYWYCPLIYFLNEELNYYNELVIDGEIIKDKEAAFRKSYGLLLVNASEYHTEHEESMKAYASNNVHILKNRIDNIINPRIKYTSGYIMVLFVVINLLIFGTTLVSMGMTDTFSKFYQTTQIISVSDDKYLSEQDHLMFELGIHYQLIDGAYGEALPIRNGLVAVLEGEYSKSLLRMGTVITVELTFVTEPLQPRGVYLGFLERDTDELLYKTELYVSDSKAKVEFTIPSDQYYNLCLFNSSVDTCYIKEIFIEYK